MIAAQQYKSIAHDFRNAQNALVHAPRIGTTIQNIAQQNERIARRFDARALQQRGKRAVAAVNIADDYRSHTRRPPIKLLLSYYII